MRYTRAFFLAAVLAVAAPLTACSSGLATASEPPTAPSPAPSATTEKAATKEKAGAPATAKTTKAPTKPKTKPKARAVSDLSGLKVTDIEPGASVLIDAFDGDHNYLAVGEKTVDFTGTGRTDTTMMSFQPAAVSAPNRVVIMPPFWNEDLGDGYCVADTAGAPLKLEVCQPGKPSQTWRVALAGDSGLFELHGAYGVLSVANGRLTTSKNAQTELQVVPYAE